jgi:hypothetical protein
VVGVALGAAGIELLIWDGALVVVLLAAMILTRGWTVTAGPGGSVPGGG